MGRSRLAEVCLLFLRVGFTAFGGPPAHISLLESECVGRRGWLDREHFLDLLSSVNFIPGPNSTQLAIHLGYLRAGYAGLVCAGVCFIVPAVLIILPIAWVYVTYGSLPQMREVMAGINATVLAVVAAAAWRLARSTLKGAFPAVLAVAAMAGALVGRRYTAYQPDLLILAAAAIAGVIRARRGLPVMPMLVVAPVWPPLVVMALEFLKIGGTLFGSGYVLISYLQAAFVDRLHWLTPRELLDSVAVGQVTPGPLLTTATFIGYVVGHAKSGGSTGVAVIGAVLATVAIFLPSFVFIAVLAPLLPRIRANRTARAALDGLNPAVVGLIAAAAVRLGGAALGTPMAVGLFIAALVLLVWVRVNPTWVILAGAGVGLASAYL